MKTTTARASLIVLLLCCLLPPTTQASPVELNFAGTVNFVQDPFGLVGSLVAIGDPILASVRYDTTTTDFYPADPTRGTYLSPGWLTVAVNGLAFEQTSGVQVDVLHGFNAGIGTVPRQESFSALVTSTSGSPTTWPASLPLFSFYHLFLQIGETTLPPSLLSSDALPPSLDLALADFARGEVGSSTSDRSMYAIQFQLDGVMPEPVSEPGTLALLIVGGAASVVRRRWRR